MSISSRALIAAAIAVLYAAAAAAQSITPQIGGGIGWFDGGTSQTGGARLTLSNSTISSTAAIGTTIGTLAVIGGTGVYTFTLTSNPGTLFAISGADLNVAATLTAGSDSITIQASNGAGSVITQPLVITVTSPTTNALLANTGQTIFSTGTTPILVQ
jgi:hypothetical protein